MASKTQNKLSDGPDYKTIYKDLIYKKYPEKINLFHLLFNKDFISSIEIVRLNKILFGYIDSEAKEYNKKLKSYDKRSILNILVFQKKNNLNNTQTAKHFTVSRNTIAKWRKIFPV